MRSGVILAGGRGSRMGQGPDKALLNFENRPMIMWVMERLKPMVDELIISISYGERSHYLKILDDEQKVKIVEDKHSNIGPIGGILTSFEVASGEYVAIAPCDSPLIVPEIYELLFRRTRYYDGAVPRLDGYLEPMHTVFKRTTMLIAMNKAVAVGNYKCVDTYSDLDLRVVEEHEITQIDPELRSFININTPDDLKNCLVKSNCKGNKKN